MVKKYLMTLIWRISQTGPFLALFFWGTALAGIFWPIVGRSEAPPGPLWTFVTKTLGISPTNATLVGLALLFLFFATIILSVGYAYDHVFKLWREQMDVAMERNPYAEDTLFRKERLQWHQYYLPLARAMYRVSPDPELGQAIARVEQWIATGRIDDSGVEPWAKSPRKS